MRKRSILCITTAVLLCATMMMSAAFAADNKADEWDNLYYEPAIQTSARSSSAGLQVADEVNILNGKSASFSQVVQIHILSYNTIDEETITAFANAIKGGERMADMLDATDTYMAQNGSDTLIMTRNGTSYEAQALIERDAGDTFAIDAAAKTQLNTRGMAPVANTTVKCVGVPAVGTAVFFAEGDAEYIVFNVSRYDNLVKPDTVYTVKELASIMDQNKATFALPPLDSADTEASEID